MASEFVGLVALVVVTGLIHGAEPGHGWPVAAAYAFNRENVWIQGIAASTILGVGHMISSIVVVLGFFWAKSAAGLGEVPWLNYVAGSLLILLGVYEYVTGGHSHGHDDGHTHGHDDNHEHSHGDDHTHEHSHGDDHTHEHSHGDGHEHSHGDGHTNDHADHSHGSGPVPEPAGAVTLDDVRSARDGGSSLSEGRGRHDHSHGDDHGHTHDHDHGHSHDHSHGDGGVLARVRRALPFGGGHSHDHLTAEDAESKGLWGIAWTAFVLGFAHEEEFELIGICTGTNYCVELTLLYAASVIFALVGLTALLLAGYERYEDRMSEYAEHFPTVSAAVLILMGIGFIAGIF